MGKSSPGSGLPRLPFQVFLGHVVPAAPFNAHKVSSVVPRQGWWEVTSLLGEEEAGVSLQFPLWVASIMAQASPLFKRSFTQHLISPGQITSKQLWPPGRRKEAEVGGGIYCTDLHFRPQSPDLSRLSSWLAPSYTKSFFPCRLNYSPWILWPLRYWDFALPKPITRSFILAL